jgi:hypothetical protein
VRRDVAPPPPKAGKPQGEARQPIRRGPTVTPKPENQKDKKDKKSERERNPD